MLKTILGATAFALMASAASAATLVSFDATGADSASTAGFFGVSVSSTDGSAVSSVAFDLTPQAGAFFDFDGFGSFNNATAPVLSSLVGITAGDISFGFVGPAVAPTVLTLNFAAGTFADGDSLRFGADTDSFLGGPPDPGGDFGDVGVIVSATVGGDTLSTPYVKQSNTVSTATLEFDVTPVPLPAGLPLLLTGILAFGVVRRMKSAA